MYYYYYYIYVYIDVLGNLDNKNIVYSFTLETKWSVTAGHSTFIRSSCLLPGADTAISCKVVDCRPTFFYINQKCIIQK